MKTIKGEPVRVGVAMLVPAASTPVHIRLVYRESGLVLNTEFGCKCDLGLLQKQKK